MEMEKGPEDLHSETPEGLYEAASAIKLRENDGFVVPTWKFGCKSLSAIQPEENNKDEAGLTEQKMLNFNASFVIDIDKFVDNVSASLDKTGNNAIGQSRSLATKEDPNLSKLKNMVDTTFTIALKFEDVKYKVNADTYIVNGVSGLAKPGEVLALMGPSGSGKTTLLNLLSGRTKTCGGAISYNNLPYTKSLKKRIGFVTQDDVVFCHLTVKETLTYAALLRLPNTLTKQQKKDRAMDVITELGLERSQNTVIGGKFVKGISGGERKRVCIGHEILLNPSLLFLDEPTSGLDSTTALRMVQILQNMAKDGKTVVTTIHQPSSRLFSKFDKLLLLGGGSSLYFGKASEAMTYFSSIGFSPLIPMNPAEFLTDLANGNVNDKYFPTEFRDKFLPENHREEPSPAEVYEYLLEAYKAELTRSERTKPLTKQSDVQIRTKLHSVEWGATWWEQFLILVRRSFKERRHEYFSLMRVTQVIATAVIIGLLWWHCDASSPQQFKDQEGLLFFVSVFWGFFPLFTAVFTFPQERTMLAKERAVGMYRLTAYFAARNISDLPLDLIMPTMFISVVYFMVGLKLNFTAFSQTMLTIYLSIIAAQGLGLAVGAAFMDAAKATTFASIIIMTFMLSGGFFLQNVPSFMSWLRYISFNYHTYKLLLKIQHSSSDLSPRSSSHRSSLITDARLINGGYEIAAMMVMIVAYRLLAYLFLRKMKLKN